MADFSTQTETLIQTALSSKQAADAATAAHNTALSNLATAQQQEASSAQVESQAHQQASNDALTAIQAIAQELNYTLPSVPPTAPPSPTPPAQRKR